MDALTISMIVSKDEKGAEVYYFSAEGGLSLTSVPSGLDVISGNAVSVAFTVSVEGQGDTAAKAITGDHVVITASAVVSFKRVTDDYSFSIIGKINGTFPCVSGRSIEGHVFMDLNIG